MDKREECPLCGGDIWPKHASGTASNGAMVCVFCDGKDMPQNQKENITKQIHDKVKLIGTANYLPNKFIAIYGDGSGASVIRRWCSVYFIFADDEEETLCTIDDIEDAGFVFYVPLPDSFEIFGEK